VNSFTGEAPRPEKILVRLSSCFRMGLTMKGVFQMKKIGLMIIAVIMSAALLALDSLPPQLPVAGPDAKISSGAILEQVVARLKRVEQLVYPELNRRTMADAAAILNEAYALLQLLPQDMDISVSKSDSTADIGAMIDPARGGYTPSRLVPRPRPVPERYPIMTDEFNQLLQTVMDEPFRRNKLTIITTASESYRYSADQIIRILEAFHFSQDRLQALQTLYPGCTDPQNRYRILDSFSTIGDKTKAAELMRD